MLVLHETRGSSNLSRLRIVSNLNLLNTKVKSLPLSLILAKCEDTTLCLEAHAYLGNGVGYSHFRPEVRNLQLKLSADPRAPPLTHRFMPFTHTALVSILSLENQEINEGVPLPSKA